MPSPPAPRILISADIEGIAGVFHPEQTRPGNPEYERARHWMAAEASAAAQGALDAGAAEVYINDSHGGFRNMPASALVQDPRVQIIQGKPRYLSMVSGVELGVQGVLFIGYHSRAQGRGILAHTINSFAFARVRINGAELGEAPLYAALAGAYGAPVLLAAGDDAFIAETQPLLPHTTFVQTKRASGSYSGITLTPQAACAAIHSAARQAVQNLQTPHPAHPTPTPFTLPGPLHIELQTQTPALADLFCQWPTLERTAGDELRFTAPHIEAAIRILNSLSAMSTMLR